MSVTDGFALSRAGFAKSWVFPFGTPLFPSEIQLSDGHELTSGDKR